MSEEAVCQTCGDRGFPEALNYCVKCGQAAEHTYCLEKLPEDFNEDISWTCENCISRTVGDSLDNFSAAPVVRGQCIGICRQEAPYPRRRKRRWLITYAACLKIARKCRSRSPSWMMESAMVALPKLDSQNGDHPVLRK